MKKLFNNLRYLSLVLLFNNAYATSLEVAAGTGLVASRTVTSIDKQDKDANAVTSIVSLIDSVSDYNLRVGILFGTIQDIHMGLSLGLGFDLPFGTLLGTEVSNKVGAADAAQATINDTLKQASSYLSIPVMYCLRYDIVEIMKHMYVSLDIRLGLTVNFDVMTTAPDGFNPSYLGFAFETALGWDYYGAKVELGYRMNQAGGYVAKEKVEDSNPAFYNSKTYSNHSMFISLGWIGIDLF